MGLRVVGVIPARLDSTRLPRKVMRLIRGRPMIAWVYERAREAKCLDRLLVATDSEEVRNFCETANIPVMMTSREHRSGTDRVIEVISRERADICVNVQGDEPTVAAEHIELLLRPFQSESDTQVSTLKVAITPEMARDPNTVKVVTDAQGRALYFSRAPIPFDREGTGGAQYFKHLGLYAYSAVALERFSRMAPSRLEEWEKLEQLRFLENGIPILVVETSQDTIHVDTEDDLCRVEGLFARADASAAR